MDNSELRELRERLDNGFEKIEAARAEGRIAAVAAAEDKWIALLQQYEALWDALQGGA